MLLPLWALTTNFTSNETKDPDLQTFSTSEKSRSYRGLTLKFPVFEVSCLAARSLHARRRPGGHDAHRQFPSKVYGMRLATIRRRTTQRFSFEGD